jgi:hypothetical protein
MNSHCSYPSFKELSMKFTTKLTAVSIALIGAIGGAQATVLVANAPVYSVDVSAVAFGGTLLDSAITNVTNASYNGIARTAVYQTESGLDFYYQFSNDISSQNGVERFSGWDFSALGTSVVNVYQTSSAFGIFTAGTEKSDGADRTTAGVIAFSFIPNGASKVTPGTTSFTQVIRTNATNYTTGNFGLLDGIADNAAGFAVAAVPEPETYAMMLAGLGLMATIARRRKAKKS